MDLERIGADAETWEKVVKKVRTGMMPPSGARRPERAALDDWNLIHLEEVRADA